MKKFILDLTRSCALVAGLFSISQLAYAAPYTIGSLTYDSAQDPTIIVDTLNNRDWLRWDELSTLSYTDTLQQTLTGSYTDWTMANHADALLFLNALVPAGQTVSCQSDVTFEGCWTENPAVHNYNTLVGDSHEPGENYDTVFFVNNGNAGFIQSNKIGSLITIKKDAMFNTLNVADSVGPIVNIGWLLYRNHPVTAPASAPASVSEPAGLGLMGLFILGLAGLRHRRVTRRC